MLCPKAMGTGGWKGEEKQRKCWPWWHVSLYSGSTLGSHGEDRGTERLSNLPKATQRFCQTGKPAFVQDTTYCRLIKAFLPAGQLMGPSLMALSQTADPASQAGWVGLRPRYTALGPRMGQGHGGEGGFPCPEPHQEMGRSPSRRASSACTDMVPG